MTIDDDAGDRYDDEGQAGRRTEPPDSVEDDDYDSANKSAAEEAIERVKEIVGRGKEPEESDEQR